VPFVNIAYLRFWPYQSAIDDADSDDRQCDALVPT